MSKDNIKEILNTLNEMFPDVRCELNYSNLYELLIAVILSAQTTDKHVNVITPSLFKAYPNFDSLAKASQQDVINIIKPLGLSTNKSKSIIKLANSIVNEFNSEIPSEFDKLITLAGVGRKTANVYLSEGLGVPRIAVDTHVERVSKRLGICDMDASVLDVEKTLMSLIDESMWHKSHHLLLFFGRYFCLSKNPKCENCPFKSICKK